MIKNIWKKIYSLICAFCCNVWWPQWSNIRFCRSARKVHFLDDQDRVSTLADIKILLGRLYQRFTWTADDPTQCWDAINSPCQAYADYLHGALKDDCDGFHASVYHCLRESNIKCYLLSVCALNSGHCVLIFTLNSKWYVIDYTKIYSEFDTLNEAIEDYNKIYTEKYQSKEVVYNATLYYNYDFGKWHSIDKSQIH